MDQESLDSINRYPSILTAKHLIPLCFKAGLSHIFDHSIYSQPNLGYSPRILWGREQGVLTIAAERYFAAVGMGSLPGNIAVEIEMIVEVDN